MFQSLAQLVEMSQSVEIEPVVCVRKKTVRRVDITLRLYLDARAYFLDPYPDQPPCKRKSEIKKPVGYL